MHHDTKIAIAVRDDLEVWQKLNVVAFLASGVAARAPESIGEAYHDAGGVPYLAIFGQPVLVFAGDADALAKAHRRALERNLELAIYTEGMRSEEHTSELQSLMRISYAVFCLKNKKKNTNKTTRT